MEINEQKIKKIIARGEGLALEFKSDRKCLPDRDLIAALVALANTDGGELLLGVEDDGTITGLHSNHQNTAGLPALIANKTSPPISVHVEQVETQDGFVARIIVLKSRQLVSTSEGLLQRRRLKIDGTPEAVPFYPHEFAQRQSFLGLLDASAAPVMGLSSADLDSLERQRIREAIRRFGGDLSLLPLADNEFDGALGFTIRVDGVPKPTVAGLLFLGREMDLRSHIPSHEVAFQVLDGTDVKVNEFFRKPLIQIFEEVEQLFKPWIIEKETQVGLFRVPVPNFDRRAFREAFVNALIHRDYSRLGAVHIRIENEGMTISSPGGFVEGVTLQNLLVTEPRPRNPLLADIAKRIGLAERTGRGIDRIFEGLLRYGRSAPDYTRSDTTSVVLRVSHDEADFDFLEMILAQENSSGRDLPLDSLIILSRLRDERRLTTMDLAPSTQKSEQETRAVLEKLAEAGMVESHGTGRGRSYTLSLKVYKKTGQKAAYVRQAGFEPIQQEQMILSYIDKHGSIKRGDVMDLCHLTQAQAYHRLNNMKKQGKIQQQGTRRGAFYTQMG
ncbi:MAG: ATP-binding protein [Desulfobacterium sp.]|jgi:ATP-dependent DNA helicase RecG|nr:ATP-binding protein [Desulfobacterium sp.]